MRVLQAPRALFGLAAISLWEVGKKAQVGKLPLPKEICPCGFADALAPNLLVLALNDDVVVEAMRLPDFPNRDLADELIVATARVHRLTLLTTDTKLKGYTHAHVHYFKPKPVRQPARSAAPRDPERSDTLGSPAAPPVRARSS